MCTPFWFRFELWVGALQTLSRLCIILRSACSGQKSSSRLANVFVQGESFPKANILAIAILRVVLLTEVAFVKEWMQSGQLSFCYILVGSPFG